MNIKGNSLENKVLFWACIGPCIIMCSLLISMIQSTTISFYVPVLIVVGVPICWYWQRRGLIGIISLLAVFFAIWYSLIAIEGEKLWVGGLITTLAFGFFTMTLSFEEVIERIQSLQCQSNERLEKIILLDEKLETEQKKCVQIRQELDSKLESFSKKKEKQTSAICSYEKLIEVLRKEYKQLLEKQECLVEELMEVRKDNSELRRVDSKDVEKKCKELEEQLKNEKKNIIIERKEWQKKVYELQNERSSLIHKKDNEQLTDQDREIRKLKGMYNQLRKQFEEKDEVLIGVRKTLFETENKLMIIRKEQELSKLDIDPLLVNLQKDLMTLEEEKNEWQEEAVGLEKIVSTLINKNE